MNRGGAEAMLMNYYRNIDRTCVQFDFLLTEQKRCQYEEEIEQMGGKVYRVPLLTFSNPFPYIYGVREFLKEHSEYRVVHSHTSSKSAIPLWVAKNCGVPVRVCHAHSSSSGHGLEGFVRWGLGVWLKRVATDFMSCGEGATICWYGKDYLDKTHFVPNAVDMNKYGFDASVRQAKREALDLSADDCVLGMISRFHPVKNHLFALDVLANLKARGCKAKLLFVGDGELRSAIEEKITVLNLKNDVVLAGLVTDVPNYLQSMDVVLMPSFHEGLPVSLVEAQANGLPVVASTGVPHEVDVTGNVEFHPLEVNAWVTSLARIIAQGVKRDVKAVDKVRAAGYDIKTASKWLQEWYVKQYQENIK
jgi:glycosyltransferase involved in cell wall biosynthesis